jgi:tRNA uridine 5-carboxymethylaminomethyl modification enzyme
MAGMNAHLKAKEQDPFILKRSDAYIGVLIDDLINKGTDEPYRMFTSRAEYRTLLRQDNADLRLTELSYHLGLASESRYNGLIEKRDRIDQIKKTLKSFSFSPEEINPFLIAANSVPIDQKQKAAQILLRPGISLYQMASCSADLQTALNTSEKETLEQAEIQIKYDTYIEKEKDMVLRMSQLENLEIPDAFNYDRIASLSAEAVQKFKKIKPRTLGQASRISGVNPSDVQILMVYMGR